MDMKKMPDLSFVKGLIAICLGVVLVFYAHSIMLRMICFIAGILLVYYGISMINVSSVNHILHSIKTHAKKLLQ